MHTKRQCWWRQSFYRLKVSKGRLSKDYFRTCIDDTKIAADRNEYRCQTTTTHKLFKYFESCCFFLSFSVDGVKHLVYFVFASLKRNDKVRFEQRPPHHIKNGFVVDENTNLQKTNKSYRTVREWQPFENLYWKSAMLKNGRRWNMLFFKYLMKFVAMGK